MKNNKPQLDFREFLQNEFLARTSRNSRYSLRSFAHSLEVAPSSLSEIINGKRIISEKLKLKVGKALGLAPEEVQNFKSKIHGNSKQSLGGDEVDNDQFIKITKESFEVISKWYHYGILELMKTTDFKWDNSWIAKRLGITIEESQRAIGRLLNIGLLNELPNGDLEDTTKGLSSDLEIGVTSLAKRTFQKHSLENALAALNNCPLDLRDNTTMTLAINPEDIPRAKKFITKFRRRFAIEFEKNKELTEVYQLSVALAPLTKTTTNGAL